MPILRHLSNSSLAAVLLLGLTTVLTGCSQASRIVYQVREPGYYPSQADLFVIREDGSNDAVLANSPDDEGACGVTTDRRIVFNRRTPTGGDIYVVNEDGAGLRPLRATPADEICVGVTDNDMVIFAIQASPPSFHHDLYSVSANSALTTVPITLSASSGDTLPVAIGWDNRVIFAKQELFTPAETAPVHGHRYSFYSIGDDGMNLAPVVGVFLEPTFVAVSKRNRMIFSRPGPPGELGSNGGLYSRTTSPPVLSAGLQQFPHNRHPVEDLFCGFTGIGRVLLTSRSNYQVNGQDEGSGDIYIMNDDGTNPVHINHGLQNFNEMCLAGTDSWIIVGRYDNLLSYPDTPLISIWSYPASGAGNPIQLAARGNGELSFQGLTPNGRVLFRKLDPVANMDTLQSIDTDGTDLQTLGTWASTSHPYVYGFTFSRVILEFQRDQFGHQRDLEIVGAGTTSVSLSTRPGVNDLSFVYYLDDTHGGRAARCRICQPGTDTGANSVPAVNPPY